MTTTAQLMTAYCAGCSDDREFASQPIERSATIRGRLVKATVPAYVCHACGHDRDDPNHDPMVALYAEYRRAVGLLTPEQIRGVRDACGLSQDAFAKVLGMSPASIARYETGALQDEAHDNLIRACQNPSFVMERVEGHRERLGDLQYRRFKDAIAVPSPPTQAIECSNELTGNRRFVPERFMAMVHLLCQQSGPTFMTKLNKLAFYCDFIAFAKYGISISGSSYRAIQHGPVPRDYDCMLEKMEAHGVVASQEIDFGDKSGVEVSAGELPRELRDLLTDDEAELVRWVADRFKRMNCRDIRTYSHREAAYSETTPRTLISYKHAAKLQPLNEGNQSG